VTSISTHTKASRSLKNIFGQYYRVLLFQLESKIIPSKPSKFKDRKIGKLKYPPSMFCIVEPTNPNVFEHFKVPCCCLFRPKAILLSQVLSFASSISESQLGGLLLSWKSNKIRNRNVDKSKSTLILSKL
jgi:hypothetical protein